LFRIPPNLLNHCRRFGILRTVRAVQFSVDVSCHDVGKQRLPVASLPLQHDDQPPKAVVIVNGTVYPVYRFLITDYVLKRRWTVFVYVSHDCLLSFLIESAPIGTNLVTVFSGA
jgi:hypothetical protein